MRFYFFFSKKWRWTSRYTTPQKPAGFVSVIQLNPVSQECMQPLFESWWVIILAPSHRFVSLNAARQPNVVSLSLTACLQFSALLHIFLRRFLVSKLNICSPEQWCFCWLQATTPSCPNNNLSQSKPPRRRRPNIPCVFTSSL